MRAIRVGLSALLLAAACSGGPVDNTDTGSRSEGSTSSTAMDKAAPTSQAQSTESTVQPAEPSTTRPDVVSQGDAEVLVDWFVNFSKNATDDNFARLPLAGTVDLGLGPSIVKTIEADELRQPDTWQLEVELFRAYVGPFSALDTLSQFEGYEATVGEHPHCASPPVPPPNEHATSERVSVQPRLGPQDSCLMWATVDFFLEPGGEVAAITLDIYEP